METTLQKIKAYGENKYATAEKYFAVISALNSLKLTEREVQLVAFTAINGTISYAPMREDFCKRHNTTNPTINNMISRLKKIGILVKSDGKIKVHPSMRINFDRVLTLNIILENGEANKPVS